MKGLFQPTQIDYTEAKIKEIDGFDWKKASEKEKETMEAYRDRTWRKFQSDGKTWILNTEILNDLDKLFETAFKADTPIDPKLLIGTQHPIYLEAIKRYKTATVKYFLETIINKRVGAGGHEDEICRAMEAKLEWLFRNDHHERPPMPLYSRSVVVAIADALEKTPEANLEVSSFFVLVRVIIAQLGSSRSAQIYIAL
jgi:hypothetical protein